MKTGLIIFAILLAFAAPSLAQPKISISPPKGVFCQGELFSLIISGWQPGAKMEVTAYLAKDKGPTNKFYLTCRNNGDGEILCRMPEFISPGGDYRLCVNAVLDDSIRLNELNRKAAILESPSSKFEYSRAKAAIGDGINFSLINFSPETEYHWDFGESSIPAKFAGPEPPEIVYGEPGKKTITLVARNLSGCQSETSTKSAAQSMQVEIFACLAVAPENTLVVDKITNADINLPGGIEAENVFITGEGVLEGNFNNCSIMIEAGAIVNAINCSACKVYLKNGGVFTLVESDKNNVFICEKGAFMHSEILLFSETVECGALDIDASKINGHNALSNESRQISDYGAQSSDISIYPNPCENILKVSSRSIDILEISIYSFSGQQAPAEFTPSNESISADIRHLSPGIYLLKIRTIQGLVVKKFVKL